MQIIFLLLFDKKLKVFFSFYVPLWDNNRNPLILCDLHMAALTHFFIVMCKFLRPNCSSVKPFKKIPEISSFDLSRSRINAERKLTFFFLPCHCLGVRQRINRTTVACLQTDVVRPLLPLFLFFLLSFARLSIFEGKTEIMVTEELLPISHLQFFYNRHCS